MNRTTLGGAFIAAAMMGVLSCSDRSTTDPIGGTDQSPDAIVAQIQVSLASSSLALGQQTQASAVLFNRNNAQVTRTVTWTSSAPTIATVSSSGVVTAKSAGTAQIIATRLLVSGTATVSVAGATPPPPSGSNEPSGMKAISDRPFSAIDELGWNDGSGSYGKIITDATAPESPGSVLQIKLPANFGEGGGPFSGELPLPVNYRTVYVSYWAKYSSNWYGPSSNIDKTFYLYTSTGNPAIIFDMDCSGNGPMEPQVAGQDILSGGVGGDKANPFWTPNLASAIAPRGQWHHIEFVVVGNTAGNADGSINWYLNGVHVGSYSGIQFESGNTTWNLMHYTLLYTGTNNSNPPADQYNYWDNLYLSGK
jgi:hypothetical protein